MAIKNGEQKLNLTVDETVEAEASSNDSLPFSEHPELVFGLGSVEIHRELMRAEQR
jgi:hypothetical protein